MRINKYDCWLARDESEYDGDIDVYNSSLINELMLDIYTENYESLNELVPSMLQDAYQTRENFQDYSMYDFEKAKTGNMLTHKNRTIAQACIDDKQGNAPVSFTAYGNIDTNLILTILANFSFKICDECSGEDLTYLQTSIVEYTEISTILDYYKELFDKLEEYYLNIGSKDDLYRLYENFYLMSNGVLSFPKAMNLNYLKQFKKRILKETKFLTNCLKHIHENYQKDYEGRIIRPIY